MGICYGKNPSSVQEAADGAADPPEHLAQRNPTSSLAEKPDAGRSRLPPKSPYRFSPLWRSSYAPSPAASHDVTPARAPRRPFPPPSPARLIQSAFARRFGTSSSVPTPSLPEGEELQNSLNKTFGYSKNLESKYELGDEIGRGHFGYTCHAKVKKGALKGESVAVKAISKLKMTTMIAIEDVRREVKILRALTGHQNVVKFYDAYEDNNNVYIVMEYCEGGELLDRILSRGGSYSEEDAKVVIKQILNIVAFCHLQGVVHRDLKPENFLFTSKDDDGHLKAIDFGLSDFVRPDERLNDIVGSAYYVAPEVLHRSYSTEADVWSIGVISYILLCGRRPFWARTESGIFKSVLKSPPSFDEAPWSSVSGEAIDFVKRLLKKDRHKRMSAVQALAHPWLRGEHSIPLDIKIYKSVKNYLKSPSIRQFALKALSKTLTNDDLYYFQIQFMLLEPAKNGWITLDHFKSALSRHRTEAMKDSKMFDLIDSMEELESKKMNFGEFCAAAIVVPQLEDQENWETRTLTAYQIFDTEANQVVTVNDLCTILEITYTAQNITALNEWIRHNDGKLSFHGFMCLLWGTRRYRAQRPRS